MPEFMVAIAYMMSYAVQAKDDATGIVLVLEG
jgi:hypothetical protein